jgi:hypothetical protein
MYLKTLLLFLLTLAICSTTINGQNHHILSVYPTANFIGAARNSSITIGGGVNYLGLYQVLPGACGCGKG